MFFTTTPGDIPTEPWEATPGIEGFLLGFFAIGIALAFLMWSMNRHLRKIKHAATIEQQKADAARAAKTTAASKAPKTVTSELPTSEPSTSESTAGAESSD